MDTMRYNVDYLPNFKPIVETANSLILHLSKQGHIYYINEFAYSFLELSQQHVVNENIIDLINLKINQHAFKKLLHVITMQEDPSYLQNFSFHGSNGDIKWISWSLKAANEYQPDCKSYIFFGQDITELKNAQQAKELLHTHMQQAQKMEAVGTLAGGLAHDFNNLLQIIMGNIQLLSTEKQEKYGQSNELNEIMEATQRAGELAKRLLVLGRTDSSSHTPINVHEQIESLTKMLQRTLPKMITVTTDLLSPKTTIQADASQIQQLILNLCINSRDAMPRGGTLSIRTAHVQLPESFTHKYSPAQPGDYIVIHIADTGQGIPASIQKRIFDPFYTTKPVGQGTGLGLAMAYSIMKNHNGIIECHSEINRGTTFSIYFPLIPLETLMKNKAKENHMYPPAHESILWIDDEQQILKVGSQILKKYGYQVECAENGEKGIALFCEDPKKYNLVILDLSMPKMGGRECMHELLAIDNEAKVIIASGYSPDEGYKELIHEGACAFVQKPFEIDNMLQTIRSELDK